MTGRKKDPIWCNFIEIKGENKSVKAKCKKCDVIMAGLVARMKTHVKKCNSILINNINVDEDSLSDSSSIRSRSPSHISQYITYIIYIIYSIFFINFGIIKVFNIDYLYLHSNFCIIFNFSLLSFEYFLYSDNKRYS